MEHPCTHLQLPPGESAWLQLLVRQPNPLLPWTPTHCVLNTGGGEGGGVEGGDGGGGGGGGGVCGVGGGAGGAGSQFGQLLGKEPGLPEMCVSLRKHLLPLLYPPTRTIPSPAPPVWLELFQISQRLSSPVS